MRRFGKALSTLSITLFMLTAFNNCGEVKFSSTELSSPNQALGDDLDNSDDTPPTTTTGDTGTSGTDTTTTPPPADDNVQYPIPPTVSEDEAALMCEAFPSYPNTAKRTCTESAPTTQHGEAASGKTEVYALGMYNTTDYSHGTHVLEPQGLPGNRYTATMEVIVPPGANPVILALSAYEPTVWKITGATDRVQKVVLLGYHCQSQVGVSDSIVSHDGSFVQDLAGAIALGTRLASENSGTLAKAQYSYEGLCLDNRVFVATP